MPLSPESENLLYKAVEDDKTVWFAHTKVSHNIVTNQILRKWAKLLQEYTII